MNDSGQNDFNQLDVYLSLFKDHGHIPRTMVIGNNLNQSEIILTRNVC